MAIRTIEQVYAKHIERFDIESRKWHDIAIGVGRKGADFGENEAAETRRRFADRYGYDYHAKKGT